VNIDQIMNPKAPSAQELKAGLAVTIAVAEAVREAGEIPSGTVYAALVGKVTMEGYTKILGILKGAGLIEEDRSHLLRWIGPRMERRAS
jgi:hypothetical protein